MSNNSFASLPTKPVLTLALANAAAEAAEADARQRGCRVTIAVVDDGGHLIHIRRMDGVHTGTVDVAIAKARTATSFRRPSRQLAEGLAAGASVLLSLPGCLPLEGGIPVVADDHVIGAIGVSGAAPSVDDAIAQTGADTASAKTEAS